MRYWTWLLARLAVAVLLVGWVYTTLLTPSSGEKEFRRSLDALKAVNSVHYSMLGDTPTQHTEEEADLVCADDAFHRTTQMEVRQPAGDLNVHIETMRADEQDYRLQNDGRWKRDFSGIERPQTTCQRLAQGDHAWIVPDMRQMLEHGIIDKGDKKTVDGNVCREWKVTLKQGLFLEHRTVCIGVKDHLPREVNDGTSRWTYAFNTPIKIDTPVDVVPIPAQDSYRPPAPGLTLTDDKNEN